MKDIALPTESEWNLALKMASTYIKTGFLPATIKTAEQAVLIAMKGKELGIPFLQSFSSISIVQGKPTMSAELMMSLIYKNVPGSTVNFIKTDDHECIIEAKRPGPDSTFCKFIFSMDDAKRAGLAGKGPWLQYPQSMLRARAVSAMARAMFPDALSGVVYTPEEIGAHVNEDGEVLDVSPHSAGVAPGSDIRGSVVVPALQKPGATPNFESLADYSPHKGVYKGRRLKEIPLHELVEYANKLDTIVKRSDPDPDAVKIHEKVCAFLDEAQIIPIGGDE